jgi:hypothetical protein
MQLLSKHCLYANAYFSHYSQTHTGVKYPGSRHVPPTETLSLNPLELLLHLRCDKTSTSPSSAKTDKNCNVWNQENRMGGNAIRYLLGDLLNK